MINLQPSPSQTSAPSQVDYDLHGIVGIRLVNPTPGDVAALNRQLGPIQTPLSRQPDITIRFVDRLAFSPPISLLGVDDVGFTNEAFLVLRSKHKSQARVQIPFELIGQPCEILCESGLPAVPLLIPIINLTALANGALALHASAFNFNGIGALCTGWSKGGKTEMLLAFTAQGAQYIGDEWVYLSRDGQKMFGIPEPIRLWDWHLIDLPQYRARVGKRDQARLRAIKVFQSVDNALLNSSDGKLPLNKAMRRLRPVLKGQLYVDIPPQKLFQQQFETLSSELNKVFFVGSHASPEVKIQPADPHEVAQRMVFSLQYERQAFMSYYLAFRFAFPEKSNKFIETAEEIQRHRLNSLLAVKETYAVHHPYPVSIPDLFAAVRPYF
ncbi:MAG TPA: hypothetical protein VI755_12960 [Anaerolineales bacterium]|nr:hypothetical protein [Anaerolineales bacterium]